MGPYHPRLDILSNPSKKNLAMDQTTKFCNAEISKAPCHTTPALLSFPGLLKIVKKWNLKNIAKGTTDPRVEFILPKSVCKFKHKSRSNFIFRILTQHQLEISAKHQHLH